MSCPIKIGSYLLELSCVQISSRKLQQQQQPQRHRATRKIYSNFQKKFGFLHELGLFKNFWFFSLFRFHEYEKTEGIDFGQKNFFLQNRFFTRFRGPRTRFSRFQGGHC